LILYVEVSGVEGCNVGKSKLKGVLNKGGVGVKEREDRKKGNSIVKKCEEEREGIRKIKGDIDKRGIRGGNNWKLKKLVRGDKM
jgi:hypothetical protein